MTRRQSNRPDRRIVPFDTLNTDELARIASEAQYGGSSYHKLHPGDYGFVPPSNPRPSKSPCDDRRPILKQEAAKLLLDGIQRGMVSRFGPGQLPKYIWAVDGDGEVYEAKTRPGQENAYHGYRLGDDERQMRAEVLREWERRCPQG
jgi:hypothetical protein